MRVSALLRELERLEKEANTDPLQVDDAVLRAKRQERTLRALQQTAAVQPSQPPHTQPSQSEQHELRSGQQQQSAAACPVQPFCTDPDVVRSCRWTEHEKATQGRAAGSSGSTAESSTGNVKQWTTASGNEASDTSSGWTGGAEGGTRVGGALSGVKDTLTAAGDKVSEAASGIQEKISETLGDFKSKAFSR